MKSPSFTLIAVGNMWSLIKNIFSVEIAFISWANFSWPSTHQSFFGKGNSSLWVSGCQATEQKEREGEEEKRLRACCSICTERPGKAPVPRSPAGVVHAWVVGRGARGPQAPWPAWARAGSPGGPVGAAAQTACAPDTLPAPEARRVFLSWQMHVLL